MVFPAIRGSSRTKKSSRAALTGVWREGKLIGFPRQRALNLKNLRQRHPYRPFVRYDVFKDADASAYVLSDRPAQLRLPRLNFRLIGRSNESEQDDAIPIAHDDIPFVRRSAKPKAKPVEWVYVPWEESA